MSQTNLFSGSRELIPVSPYSKTPQLKTIPSAQHPIKKALDKGVLKPQPKLTPEEAKELLRKCQEGAKEVNGASKAFRRAVYEVHVQGALKVLKMGDKLFRIKVSSAVPNNSHRSTINRLCLAAAMDVKYKLPPGVVNEYALRICRTKVPEDKWGAVLTHAKKKKGLYGKITAKAIVEAARELGCLNSPADNPSQAKGGEPVGDDDESGESQDNRNQKRKAATKTPSTETATKEEAVQAWLEKLMKLQIGLEKLLQKFDEQPALIQEVVALLKDQYQQLDDLLNPIG